MTEPRTKEPDSLQVRIASREDELTKAIEPWFGEEARTAAILMQALNAEGRAYFLGQLGDRAPGLIETINRVLDADPSQDPGQT